MPPMFKHPHMCPQCYPMHLYVLEVSACDMGMQGALLMFQYPHVFGSLSMCLILPCMYVLGGICMCCGGYTPYVGGMGASAHLSGFCCLSVHPLDVNYASSCTILVVHYISCLYFHNYYYYSSSDCGVFWYVISIIDDHDSFDGASYNVRSA